MKNKELKKYMTCKECSNTIKTEKDSLHPCCCLEADYIPLLEYLEFSFYSESYRDLINENNYKKP